MACVQAVDFISGYETLCDCNENIRMQKQQCCYCVCCIHCVSSFGDFHVWEFNASMLWRKKIIAYTFRSVRKLLKIRRMPEKPLKELHFRGEISLKKPIFQGESDLREEETLRRHLQVYEAYLMRFWCNDVMLT